MAEKIRVAIVDDVTQTRSDIRRLLDLEDDIEVVGEAENGRKALDMVAQSRPHVVLMDINMPIMDGIAATEALARSNPEVSVIIISIQGEQEYLKLAMIAGAREYMVKPLSSEEMSATIRQVYQLDRRRYQDGLRKQKAGEDEVKGKQKRGKMITLFSGKGGSGKSILAANLATVLARRKQRVALVDLDLEFGDLAVMFNLSETASMGDLAAEEEFSREALEHHLVHHISGVDILAAPHWPQQAEGIEADFVEQVLEELREGYDYIFIDTAAAFSEISLRALEMSDQIIVPVLEEITAVKNLRTTYEIFYQLQLEEKSHVIINRSGRKTGIEREDLEKSLGIKVEHSLVDCPKTVIPSVNKGVPFALELDNSDLSRDTVELAKLVARDFRRQQGDKDHSKSRGGFLSGNGF